MLTGDQIRSSGAVREVPKSIMKRSSSSPADPQNPAGLAQVDPAVHKDFEVPRYEHYALKQLDTGGRTDPSASEYMADQNLGFVDARSIEAGIGDHNLPVSKCGVSGFGKGGTELGRDGNGKPSLSVTPGNHTNDPMSFPAAIKSGSSKSGSEIRGVVPHCLMGGHVMGLSGKHGGTVGLENRGDVSDRLMEGHVMGVSGRQIGAAGSEIRDDVSDCLMEGIVVGVNGKQCGDGPDCILGDRAVEVGSKEHAPVSNQLQRGIPVGGGHPNHSEQVQHTSWIRKGDREPIKC